MKKIYWRPRAVSRPALVLITLVSIAGLMVVEAGKVETRQPFWEEKREASLKAQKAMEFVKKLRIDSGAPIDPQVDPTESGLVGLPMSLVTSVSGEVTAKQTSANPNFAAVFVDMLKEADVGDGDVVAIGLSGSFPALNICAYAACETLGATPVVIASASASQWGANVPQLLWLDMESELEKAGIFRTKSIAASIGGHDDRGLGLTEDGRKLVMTGIERNGLAGERFIDIADFTENVEKRVALYKDFAEGRPIKTFINIGGGTVSVGKNVGKRMFKPGFNKRPPRHIREIDGVMPRFILANIPVIHIVHINTLATQYGLPLTSTVLPVPEGPPVAPSMPRVGDGGVFVGVNYSKPLVLGVLGFILFSLYGFIRSDIGFRILQVSQGSKKRDAQPEPMV